jgi:hypothetical protein
MMAAEKHEIRANVQLQFRSLAFLIGVLEQFADNQCQENPVLAVMST